MPRSIRSSCAILGALLPALLLAAGCGARSDSGASGGGTPATTSHPSPTTSPTTTSPTPPTAADGSRYATCADGTCEVAVARPVRIKIRDGAFSVTKVVANDSMLFKLTFSAGGGGSGTLMSTCGARLTFYLGGGGSAVTCDASGVPATPKPIPGALQVQLVGWATGGAAVLRLVSG